MSNDGTLKASMDVDDLLKGVSKAIAGLKGYKGAFDEASISNARLDATGKVVEAQLLSISKAGNKVNTTFKWIKENGVNQFKPVSQSIISTRKNVKDLDSSLEELAKTQKILKGRATKFLNLNIDKSGLNNATVNEALNLGKAKENLRSYVLEANTSKQKLDKIWQELATGSIKDYEGEERKLVEILNRLKTAQDNLGASALKAANDKASAEASVRNQQKISGNIFGNIKNFEKFNATQKVKIIEMVNRVSMLADRHKIAGAEINKMWGSVAKGQIKKYTNEQAEVQKEIVRTQQVTKNFTKGLDEHGKKINEITISWQSFARVFAFTAVRSVIFKFTTAIRSAIDTFTELDTQIAAIRTIDNLNTDVSTLRLSLLSLSNAWGIDVVDQASAAYEALSNQIGEGVTVISFLNDANALAVTTFSSAADASDLLSAAINAYGLEITQAQSLSASFFATVDLGRVKVDQIAQTYGRVAAPAAQLGISVNEVNAALALLTKRGIPVRESMTALRGIFQKLIRPSEEMKRLYKEIGVNTGEAGISTYGFTGFLKILADRTKGSSTELGALFQRVRAIVGIMPLASEGAAEYFDILKRIELASGDFAAKTDIVLESASKKYQIELNKIRNAIINDWGRPIVTTVNSLNDEIIKATNGAKSLGDVIGNISSGIRYTLVPAIAFLVGHLKILRVSIITTVSSVPPLAWALLGLTTAVEAVIYAANSTSRAISDIEEYTTQLRNEYEQQRQEVITHNTEIINIIRRTLRDQNNIYEQGLAERLSIFRDTINYQKELIKDLDLTIDSSTKNIVDSLKASVKNYESEYNKLRTTIIRLQSGLISKSLNTQQRLFQLSIESLDPSDAVTKIYDRMLDLRNLRVLAVEDGDVNKFESISKQLNSLLEQSKQLQESEINLYSDDTDIKSYVDISAKITALAAEELKLQKELIEVLREKANEQAKLSIQARIDEAYFDSLLTRYKNFKISSILEADTPEEITKVARDEVSNLNALITAARKTGADVTVFEEKINSIINTALAATNDLKIQTIQETARLAEKDLQENLNELETGLINTSELIGLVKNDYEELIKTLEKNQLRATKRNIYTTEEITLNTIKKTIEILNSPSYKQAIETRQKLQEFIEQRKTPRRWDEPLDPFRSVDVSKLTFNKDQLPSEEFLKELQRVLTLQREVYRDSDNKLSKLTFESIGETLERLREVIESDVTLLGLRKLYDEQRLGIRQIKDELGISLDVNNQKYEYNIKLLEDTKRLVNDILNMSKEMEQLSVPQIGGQMYNTFPESDILEKLRVPRNYDPFIAPPSPETLPTIDQGIKLKPIPVTTNTQEPVQIFINMQSVSPEYDAVSIANALETEINRGRIDPLT